MDSDFGPDKSNAVALLRSWGEASDRFGGQALQESVHRLGLTECERPSKIGYRTSEDVARELKSKLPSMKMSIDEMTMRLYASTQVLMDQESLSLHRGLSGPYAMTVSNLKVGESLSVRALSSYPSSKEGVKEFLKQFGTGTSRVLLEEKVDSKRVFMTYKHPFWRELASKPNTTEAQRKSNIKWQNSQAEHIILGKTNPKVIGRSPDAVIIGS